MRVGEAFDRVEERTACRIARRETLPGKQFTFEGSEETLCHRVVTEGHCPPSETIAPAPHRGLHPCLAQSPPQSETGVLASLVRVVDDSVGPTSSERHFDCFDDHFAAHVFGHCPTHHATSTGIAHDC